MLPDFKIALRFLWKYSRKNKAANGMKVCKNLWRAMNEYFTKDFMWRQGKEVQRTQRGKKYCWIPHKDAYFPPKVFFISLLSLPGMA